MRSTLNLKNKKVEIKIPNGLIIAEYPKPNSMTGLVAGVTPEDIKDLNSENDYGGYRPKSGTITYSLRDTAESSSFNIILAPDTTLWNKKIGTKVAQALEIRVYSGDIDDESAQTEYGKVSKNAKITGTKLTSGPIITAWNNKRTVPETAGTPFKMQQVRFRADRNRFNMGMFFRELSITTSLPYNSTKDTYAEYVRTDFDTEEYGDNYFPDPKWEVDNDKHTVTLTWENLYIPRDDYFTPYFQWAKESDCDAGDVIAWRNSSIPLTQQSDGNTIESQPAAIGGKIIYADGSTVNIVNDDFNKPGKRLDNFKAAAGSEMKTEGKQAGQGTSAATGVYNVYDIDPNVVYYLGQFWVSN